MTIWKAWIVSAAGAAALAAQQGTVDGPIGGYVFDAKAKSLRTIRGVPGAALVGDAVDFGGSAASAWVSPGSDSAVVVDNDGAPHVYRLDGGKAIERKAEGLVAPERVVYSPNGKAVAIVTPGSVRIYSGLPDAPSVTGTVELPPDRAAVAVRGKRPRPGGGAVAVSDDGRYLMYGNGDAIELIGVDGGTRILTSAQPGATPVFAPDGHDAAVIDAQTVVLVQDAANAATVRRFPGIAGVRGAAFSPDGKRLFVAAGSVVSMDVASGGSAEVACDCRPAQLVRMGSVYRLNELGSGPLWLLDAAGDARVLFVPAAQ